MLNRSATARENGASVNVASSNTTLNVCGRAPAIRLINAPDASTKATLGSNVAHLTARYDERTGKAFVFAAIDNLWKGASSQAVQNLNLMFDIDETVGLL